MNIKTKFDKLSKKEIVQLYLIVLISHSLIYILYIDNKSTNDLTKQVKMNNINKNMKAYSDVELLDYFTQMSKKYNIIIDEVKISKNTIDIKTKEKYENIMTFLSIVNKTFHIKSFEMKKEKHTISFFIRLNKKNVTRNLLVFNNKKEIKQELKNPFLKRSIKEVQKAPEIILSAIIKDEVLINNSWYKKGDEIYGYKIDSILRLQNKVVFVDIDTNTRFTKSIDDE